MSDKASNKEPTIIKKIKIIIADDHPLIRQALRTSLEKQPDFEVIGEARDGEEVVKLTVKYIPDVVIMDISMPRINGIEATKQIKKECPTVAILILTVHQDPEYVSNLIQAGASGYLTKSVFGDEVVNTVRTIVSGETVLSPSIIKTLFTCVTNPIETKQMDATEMFSVRQQQILILLADGKSNKEIARQLNLGIGTVKGHLSVIFMKLNAASRTEAITNALRSGVLSSQYFEQRNTKGK
ncbi:MAG: response regulator transcription factor [Dehalococcoidales bacterium]|nr:response regulator transcription factor [Dehalococcoidales bacterium]